MGWTFEHIDGKINRKKIVENLIDDEHYTIVKSVMVGSQVYMAVHDKSNIHIFALIVPTKIRSKGYFNFGWNLFSEDDCPLLYDNCPESILNLLSSTDDECTLEWRKKCREKIAAKKMKKENPNSLDNLGVGSIIEATCGEDVHTLIKSGPMGQFRRPFWKVYGCHKYVPKTQIDDYKVVCSVKEV